MNLPAHLANRNRPTMALDAIGGLGGGRGPHLSITDNRFTWVDSAGNTRPVQTLYVDVVIVGANKHASRIYYDPSKPYNKDDSAPPLCFSDNGIGASAQAAQPQNNSCQLCSYSSWNSAVSKMTGKGVPACQSSKKLAIVPAEGSDIVFQLKVPPASLPNWLAYVKTLAPHGLEPYDVFTRVEFASQGVLKFSPAAIGDQGTAYATAAIAALTERIWAANATVDATGANDIPWTGQSDAQKLAYASQGAALPPPAPQQAFMPPPQPVAQAAPVAQPFMPPPAPATPFGTPAPGGAFSPPVPEPAKRTRRTKAEIEAANAQAAPSAPFQGHTGDPMPGIPPFLQRAPEPAQALPASPPPLPAFGMNPAPAAPDAGIQAALDAAFRLPT